MPYLFKGLLRGRLGAGVTEPLADATLKFYRLPQTEGTAIPTPNDFALLTAEQVRDKEYLLFASGRTDERGAFTVDLAAPTVLRPAIADAYAGEEFAVDVLCTDVPGRTGEEKEMLQFTLGLVRPEWRGSDGTAEAEWGRELSEEEWGRVRAHFDAWVICGRVASRDGRVPQPGLKVLAFDADVMQDDPLGSAVTDEQGAFRIDYSSRAFRNTPLPLMGFESGGPDVYFRVETRKGFTLLDQKPQGRARVGGVGAACYVELAVATPDVPMPPQAT